MGSLPRTAGEFQARLTTMVLQTGYHNVWTEKATTDPDNTSQSFVIQWPYDVIRRTLGKCPDVSWHDLITNHSDRRTRCAVLAAAARRKAWQGIFLTDAVIQSPRARAE